MDWFHCGKKNNFISFYLIFIFSFVYSIYSKEIPDWIECQITDNSGYSIDRNINKIYWYFGVLTVHKYVELLMRSFSLINSILVIVMVRHFQGPIRGFLYFFSAVKILFSSNVEQNLTQDQVLQE